MKENMKYFIKMHYELHGKCFDWDSCWDDYWKSNSNEIGKDKVYESNGIFIKEIEDFLKSQIQYGVFIGRASPFTDGHNAIIQEILRDNKKPIIILGGKGKKDDRHPLSYEDRVKLIKKVYPTGVIFIGLEDQDNWDNWYNSLEDELRKKDISNNQITLYSHNKNIDRVSFVYRSKKYKKETLSIFLLWL